MILCCCSKELLEWGSRVQGAHAAQMHSQLASFLSRAEQCMVCRGQYKTAQPPMTGQQAIIVYLTCFDRWGGVMSIILTNTAKV